MFIQTEDTPNPATMKFLPNRPVLGEMSPVEFANPAKADDSPLAQALFSIGGVTRVFLGSDFISVTRADDYDWKNMRPMVLQTIMDHFAQNRLVLREAQPHQNTGLDSDIEQRIRDILDQRIRPAVAMDGGDIAFDRFEDGVVYLRLRGACAGCPSAGATLKLGVERLLRGLIPEVKEVRQVR